jgi:hypothetical protein
MTATMIDAMAAIIAAMTVGVFHHPSSFGLLFFAFWVDVVFVRFAIPY